jgi:HEPN domain-containing protein
MSEEVRTTPIGLFHYAHSYAASALSLSRADVEGTHVDAPIRFLYSHAVELYLKSYLLLNGISLALLRSRELGHHVERLLERAQKLGLRVEDFQLKQAKLLNEAIVDRYIETGSRIVLSNDALLNFCFQLHNQIGPLVYLDAGLKRRLMELK